MGYKLAVIIGHTIIILGLINLVRIMLLMLGSNIYSIKEHIRRKKAKRIYAMPDFSVVIPAHNESNTIIACVKSVVRAAYPKSKIQIIVVDDGSTDDTVKILQEYKRRYKVKNLKIISQINRGKAHALNNAIKNYTSGNLVMCLDADSSIDRQALKEAAKYFKDPRVMALAANVRIRPANTVLNFTQRIEYLISYQFKRALTQFNIEYIVGGIGSVFRADVLRKVGYYDTNTITEDIDLTMKILRLGNKNNRVVYGPRVIAYTESVLDVPGLIRQRTRWKYGRTQTFFKNLQIFFHTDKKYNKALTWVYLPFIVFTDLIYFLEPVLTLYLIGASIYYKDPFTLLYAFAIISTYVVMNILAEDTLSWKERIKLAFVSPVMYFLFNIINYVDYIALVKSAANIKEIWHSVQLGSKQVCGWQHVERQKI